MSYTFKSSNDYQFTKVVCYEETLPELREAFDNFLKGCGFKIKDEEDSDDRIDDKLNQVRAEVAAHILMLQQLLLNTREFPSDQDYKNLVHNMKEVLKNARRIGMDE
jgi:uncharacterized protein YaaW (UPF0174 family)